MFLICFVTSSWILNKLTKKISFFNKVLIELHFSVIVDFILNVASAD